MHRIDFGGFFAPASEVVLNERQQPAWSRVPWWVGMSSIGAADQPSVYYLVLY